MTDSPNRYGDAPLGKSVEEIEQDAGNRVNDSTPGEDARRDTDGAAVLPAVANGTTSGVPAVLNPTGLAAGLAATDAMDRENTATGGGARENRDSSEE